MLQWNYIEVRCEYDALNEKDNVENVVSFVCVCVCVCVCGFCI